MKPSYLLLLVSAVSPAASLGCGTDADLIHDSSPVKSNVGDDKDNNADDSANPSSKDDMGSGEDTASGDDAADDTADDAADDTTEPATPTDDDPKDDELPAPDPEPSKETFTNAECKAAGGEATYDIGDGKIHRPGFLCPNGKPPIGTIVPAKGEPMAIEGAVCCGAEDAPADKCEARECLRAIECVESCGGPVIQSGCCECPKGSIDNLTCESVDLDLLNSPCDAKDMCPKGLTPTQHFGVAGPQGPLFCACSIPCGEELPACPDKTECVFIADGPGEVCDKQ